VRTFPLPGRTTCAFCACGTWKRGASTRPRRFAVGGYGGAFASRRARAPQPVPRPRSVRSRERGFGARDAAAGRRRRAVGPPSSRQPDRRSPHAEGFGTLLLGLGEGVAPSGNGTDGTIGSTVGHSLLRLPSEVIRKERVQERRDRERRARDVEAAVGLTVSSPTMSVPHLTGVDVTTPAVAGPRCCPGSDMPAAIRAHRPNTTGRSCRGRLLRVSLSFAATDSERNLASGTALDPDREPRPSIAATQASVAPGTPPASACRGAGSPRACSSTRRDSRCRGE
jgi:hypothetical protein